ncbi:Transcription initiation factor TFIID subunit 2 [Mycena indigotica]|uniref:Transcription initiation factor TFIID subunit 2 n=1 Tax=Mycena indigotica TaxID=2126181 RepID=A0A8H6SWA8_9AGAR|nr:Transcription initiation factor TFIID subunit 2 [Mycena indigotica]KAF7307415.1 Transcription initiation factor TFIID subunit 2 [Mycena indigotica]
MDTKSNPQREHTRRGFNISHQKVVLEIDFSGCLWGYTEITIVPTSKELRTVHLHSRQCTIQTVTVANQPAEFIHHDPLANLSLGGPPESIDCHRHPELKRKLYTALQEGEDGELAIAIPAEVLVKPAGGSENSMVNDFATPEPSTPGPSSQAAQTATEFAPICINIAYSLRNPVDGFQFVVPTESYPYRVPHAYTTPSSPDAARCWVPCVDTGREKCTWEFEFVVPRYLEDVAFDDPPPDANPTLVVCSGELVEQVAHPFSSHKTIFLFSQPVPTSVQQIAFAAGPFHLLSIPSDHFVEEGNSTQPPMYAFCLPGHELPMTTSTSTLRSAMSFFTSEFGSYPFGSYKLAFVDEMPMQRFDSSTLSLLSVDLLYSEDAIEQALETRHALAHALACQWMGVNIQPKVQSDTWLVNGLSLYITGLYIRKLLGNNEYRFRLKKDMQRVVERDNGTVPPLCQPTRLEPPDASELPFMNLKAPLVLHCLDRKLGKSGTSLGLSRVLPKIFLSALTGDMTTLSTQVFLRTCRKVSGVDLRTFADQWIYGSGCPTFFFAASFNRKKMAVEITMRQDCPAYRFHEGNEYMMALNKPIQTFEGQMTVRIHEADGTPYEHVLDIQSNFKRYEVPFNTKYKRVRRNTKRYLARQAAAQAAAEGDQEAAEAMGLVDMGFGLEIWEKESERNNWKVEDWTEEDENMMNGATYEWIRIDADFEWLSDLNFDQPDFMWVSQLQRDRDVVAQLEALRALTKQPTAIVSSTLTKTVLVTNYYFRIRCEAALALVHCSIHKLKYLGLFHLFKLFLRYCYEPEDPKQDLFAHTYVPKPNDFSDFSEYFVRKSLIVAISRVRFDNGKSPSIVRKFLIDQLRYNDNTANSFADGFYICNIIAAAAHATVSLASPERGELLPTEVRNEYNEEDADLLQQIVSEVDRYRSMDRLIPSTHNNVTVAALEFYMILMVANLIPSAPLQFFPLTREGNYTPVRIAAFDGLFLTKWYTPLIMKYVLSVMAYDPSRSIRRHVARSACTSLALLVQMGEMKVNSKESESLLIEEDGSTPANHNQSRKTEMEAMIKALRKDKEVGKNEVFRELMMPLALSPEIDHDVRWGLLKLADLLLKPVDEVAPTVKLHIPANPVPETPPPEQSPVLPIKLKIAGPVAPSPVIPAPPTPKLILHAPTSIPRVIPKPPIRAPSADVQAKVKFAVPAVPLKARAPPKPRAPPPPPVPPKANGVAKTPKKPPAQAKAQASGMSLNDLKATRVVLKKLQSNKHAKIFLQPVDPVRDSAPNYFSVVKEPIDLGTISQKLEQGQYADRFAFRADFILMMNNAKLYNKPGSFALDATLALETHFEKHWAVINKTLDAARAKEELQAPKPEPPPPTEIVTVPAVSQPIPSTSKSAPILKLKPPQPTANGNKPSVKPPKRKPAVDLKVEESAVEPPPPPYEDDGSHDILQEVLAIERERGELQHRSTAVVNGKPSTKANGKPNGKRKKTEVSTEEEDNADHALLDLVSSKKARPSPVEASTSSAPKLTLSFSKVKAPTTGPKPSSHPPESRPASSNSHRPSTKGKEREIRAPNPRPKTVGSTPIDEKKCKAVLTALMKDPASAIFLRPVDPIQDGCPTYLDEIAHPMDFGTMSTKLDAHLYQTMEEFRDDVQLVFSNCRQFNPQFTFPYDCADALDNLFKDEWPKAMERKIAGNDKRGLQGVLTTLVKDDLSWLFREPVDPVLLNIPTYFDVIKQPRDLKSIRAKLVGDKYESIEAFEADVKLMTDNAILFNGQLSDVGQIAVKLQDKFEQLLQKWKEGMNKKRKEPEKSNNPQPAKRQKMG